MCKSGHVQLWSSNDNKNAVHTLWWRIWVRAALEMARA